MPYIKMNYEIIQQPQSVARWTGDCHSSCQVNSEFLDSGVYSYVIINFWLLSVVKNHCSFPPLIYRLRSTSLGMFSPGLQLMLQLLYMCVCSCGICFDDGGRFVTSLKVWSLNHRSILVQSSLTPCSIATENSSWGSDTLDGTDCLWTKN